MTRRTISSRLDDQAALAKMMKALANPNRLQLFEEIRGAGETRIADGHACLLNHVVERLNIGAPTISHHLKELVNAGLVLTEKQGKFVLCRINQLSVKRLAHFFVEVASAG